jgi:predicted nucleotidyltransferase component of viral defense system
MKSAISIRARLLNISRNEALPFQQILFRFFHERFLARLALSDYKKSLLLKGGNFIYAVQGKTARPTIDIDFLGTKISNNTDEILKIIKIICEVNLDDFVHFNTKNITAIPITEQKTDHGTRVKIEVMLDSIKQNIQIDVGFGDIITPKPIEIQYPVILEDFQSPILLAYNPETAIAEKLHAITVLAGFNSRMKDYYDIYYLERNSSLKNELLLSAIQNTFSARQTEFNPSNTVEIMNDFAKVENNIKMWNTFLKKIKAEEIECETVVKRIGQLVDELFDKN